MKYTCTCSTFHYSSSTLSWFCGQLIYFQNLFVVVVVFFFSKKILGISVECQAVWIQIMSVRPDLGPNCLQRLSADDTRKLRVY